VTVATVPRLWPGETVVILASGPSLCADDVDYCRGHAKVIAVKDAVQLAPWADVLYGCGADASRWWQHHGDTLKAFGGLRYTLDPQAAKWATVLQHTGESGLETNPAALRTGKNSTYQAINLAVHLGAIRILLLGLDLAASPHGTKYFFGNRPAGQQRASPFDACLALFATLVAPLKALGVTVINCSRQTALTCFPRQPIQQACA
jgi:hypothetical protein